MAWAIKVNDISVVITCYSEGKLILDAIESIHQQSFPAQEIILVNDASTDIETNQVCQQLDVEPQVRVVWRQQNGGTSEARNDGFKAAQGNVIVPLDADDVLPRQALEIVFHAFHAHPDAGFIYGSYLRQDRVDSPAVQIYPGDISLQTMLKSKPCSLSSNWKLIGTTPLRRSLWESMGGYKASFGIKSLHDVEFWMRVLASDCPYYSVSEPIYAWRKYLGKNSRRVTPLAWYELAKEHLSIYRHVGLEYRAYELLLLGSKWLNHKSQVKEFSRHLFRRVRQGDFRFSTIVALIIPSFILAGLAHYAQQRR
ncbi:glycosyltransferase family 2 protein [Synechococcus sp. PCC 7336]|uniref:glycosyltransferase family 2 protein n=1 Tax=Synechococcus sp. PCC 7336 TaxID=195250 RepID=UPI00034CD4C6|nr:glycosyltransferase family 2 protein [Synechococcus sp. PCC 7336]